MDYNLATDVYRHALAHPEWLAVASETHDVSYLELARRACNLAAQLRAQFPGGTPALPRPSVAILASRSIDACVAVLGSAWAGATYIPIGTKAPVERVASILATCRPVALIADAQGAELLCAQLLAGIDREALVIAPDLEQRRELIADSRQCWLDTQALDQACELQPPANFAPEALAYIIFTSGTTGVPKGVMIPARAAHAFLDMISARLSLEPCDRTLEVTELSFDVSVMNMFGTWRAGASLHVLPATKVLNAVRFARERQITVWSSTPALIGLLRQVRTLAPNSLPALRLALFAGEPLCENALQAWRAAAPQSSVDNLYGPTEATVVCCGQHIEGEALITPGRGVVAIGRPLPGNELMVLNVARQVAAPGEIGELAIAGAQLGLGYLGAKELSARCFPEIAGKRWYVTGDSAFCDADGSLHHLGRIDNQVKILGNRVELEEVEAHLRELSGVDLVAAVPWPTIDGSHQGLVAFLCDEAASSDPALLSALRKRLPSYMVPARLAWVDHMPVNPNGKIDRLALVARLQRSEQAAS